MAAGRPGGAAWGRSAESRGVADSDTPFATTSRPSEFPALGTAGPSKAALRKKATYALPGTRFDAYPSRHDTLARFYLEQEGLYYPPYDDMQLQNEEEENAALAAHAAEIGPQQRNGMSSVVIYDADGQRLNSGPDIYGGRKSGKKKAKWKDFEQDISEPSSGVSTPLTKETQDRRRTRSVVAKEDLPSSMTADRIDHLIQEHRRHQQLRAIERRQNHSVKNNTQADGNPIESPSILQDEITKAFSSIDGFLSAFAGGAVE